MSVSFSQRPAWQKAIGLGSIGFFAAVAGLVLVAPDPAPATDRAEMAVYRGEIARLGEGCAAAQGDLAAALEASADAVRIARAATAMRESCGGAWIAAGEIDRPEGFARKDAEGCRRQFFTRQKAAERVIAMIEGERAASAPGDIARQLQRAEALGRECEAALDALVARSAERSAAQ